MHVLLTLTFSYCTISTVTGKYIRLRAKIVELRVQTHCSAMFKMYELLCEFL